MPQSIADRVITVIAKAQHLSPEAVTIDSTFEELKIDSLDGINIVFAIEEEFGIEIPDDSAKLIRSVRDVATGVEQLLAAKAALPPATEGTVEAI
jgi:acyl carrier protein